MTGTLYLLGVGPGNPELLTLKAARILSEVAQIAYPQKPDTPSFALEIIKDLIPEDTSLLPLSLPMKVDR